MKIRVRVRRHEQFGRLARKLRDTADGGLRQDLAAELQRTAPPVLAGIKARVLRAQFPAEKPSPNPRPRATTGQLRGRLAAATKTVPLSSPPGVRFTVDGEIVTPGDGRGGHRLALYTAGLARNRWRHRIFGRDPEAKGSWFNQKPDPWFGVPVAPWPPAVERAMDRTARRITR